LLISAVLLVLRAGSKLCIPSDFAKDGVISFGQRHAVHGRLVASARWYPSLRVLRSSGRCRRNCSWGWAHGWSVVPAHSHTQLSLQSDWGR